MHRTLVRLYITVLALFIFFIALTIGTQTVGEIIVTVFPNILKLFLIYPLLFGAEVFTLGTTLTKAIMLLGGITLLLSCYVAVFISIREIQKSLKHDLDHSSIHNKLLLGSYPFAIVLSLFLSDYSNDAREESLVVYLSLYIVFNILLLPIFFYIKKRITNFVRKDINI